MRLSILSTAVTIFCLYFFQKAQFPKLNEAFVPANIEAEECLTDLYLQQQLAMSPSFKKEHEKTEEQALRFFRSYYGRGEKSLLGGFTLPIVIHVIHQNGPENVPDWQIIQAIEWLNDGFENINYYDQGVGVNTGIQFCLAKRDPDGNATSGINRVQSPLTNVTDDLAMKNLSRWDPTRYINIWLVADANGAGGYSTLPASHGSPTDGIVMKAEKIMNVGSGHSTMIHEMGHYLGLNHTFNGGCTNNDCLVDGDKVCDTPPDGSTAPPPACSISINSCNTDTNSGFPTDQDDLTWNYVDYGNYSCRAGYTQGQADRMCYFIENVRSSLLNTDACLDPCPNPFIASFNSSATDIMLGETVNFLNTSTGGNNYEWQIDGNVFSNNTNANYVFNTGAGDFVISLMATVADPNCTEIYYDTVHVECPAVASFTAMNLETVSGGTIGFINNSSNANNYEWLIDGVVFSTNTNASYTFPSVGRYKITLIATDISGLCQEEYSLFVNVSCMAASFTSSDLFPAPGDNVGFINTSQGGNSYTWTINGNIESNNTDFSFSFPNAGVFSVCLEGVNGNCEDVFCQELFVFESGGGECEGTFVRRIGNSLADEQAYFLLPYKNGNFIIGGRDDTRSILLEVDASGNILTQRAIDFTNGNDFIRYLIVDSESYLIGATRDQPDASTVNHVFKYDFENDDFIWVRELPDPAYTRIDGILEKPNDGNYIFYGMTNPGAYDQYILEIDKNTGQPQWQRQYDFGGNTDNFNRHFILGNKIYFASTVRLGGSINTIRSAIFKLDFSGVQEWGKMYLSTPTQNARSYNSDLLIENDMILNFSRGNLSGTAINDFKVQLFNTDIDGNIQWAKEYAILGSGQMSTRRIHSLPDGFILHGIYQINGEWNSFFIRVDKNGGIQWSKGFSILISGSELVDNFICFTGYDSGLSPSGDEDVFFGKVSLEGDIVSEGCNLIYDINVSVTDIVNPFDETVAPISSSSPAYFWSTVSKASLPLDLALNEIETCECQEMTCANGAPLHEVPDAVLQDISATCHGNSLSVTFQICNQDSLELPINTPISFYLNDPTAVNASLLATTNLPQAVQPNMCELFSQNISLPINQNIYAVINDNGTTPRPFDLSVNFPNTDILECNYANNINNFQVNYTPPILDLGPDVSQCHFGITELNAGAGFMSYNWSDASTGQIITAWEPGIYWVEVTDSCGGVQSDTISISVDLSTVLDIGMDTAYVCNGSSVTFSVSGFDNYHWYPSDHLDCDTCATVTASPDTAICYVLVAGTDDGCFSEDTVKVVLGSVMTYDTVNICAGDSALVFGNYISLPGIYSQSFQVSGNCDSIHTITLEVEDELILDIMTQTTCAGEMNGAISVDVVNGLPPYDYNWNIPGAPNSGTVNDLEPGTYSVTVEDMNACSVVGEAVVESFSDIVPTLNITDALCFGEATGALEVFVGLNNLQYSLDGINFQLGGSFADMPAGEYTLSIVDPSNGCIIEQGFTVNEPPPVFVSLPADVTIELGDTIQINATVFSDALQLIWQPGIGLSCNDCTGPLAGPEETTLYTLEVADTLGCNAIDSLLITVEFNPNIYVPNAFSPNDDGINDVFYIFAKGVESVLEFKVFDRWGELVFEDENFSAGDPLHGWDGKFRGRPMNPGVFVYYAKVGMLNGTERILKGDIVLVK